MPSLPTSILWHPHFNNAVRFVLCLLVVLGTLKAGFGQSNTIAQDEHSSSSTILAEAKRFETVIRPALIEHCIKCHGESKQEGGLRLDSLEALLRGGDSGPSVVPGDVGQSLLLSAIRHEDLEMPPGKKLDEQLLQEVQSWVANGVVWPTTHGLLRSKAKGITDEDKNWWAYKPIQPPVVPRLQDDRWSKNDIDRFVFNELRVQSIEPAPIQEPHALLRRLYLHLIGLPPTPEEIKEFVRHPSEEAYEQTVDRLLQDPRFGEHWARFWLDLVRYSESDGWNQDAYRPFVYRYRDFVIDAWNEDMPFADFVRMQLAGDESPNDDPRNQIAAGFLRLGIYEYNQRDAKNHWNDIMNEMTDVVGDAFLGLSMSCARCHDHKFDAISQEDYYKLRAFLEPIVWRDDQTAATTTGKSDLRRKACGMGVAN
jgi:hypothetical protein